MERYTHIESAAFGETVLPLPMSVRLSRRAEAMAAGGDNEIFATAVQLARPTITAEVRIRGIAAAEGLALGAQATLVIAIASASGGAGRTITLDGAVLTSLDVEYEQRSPATAILKFVAQADDGATDPFTSEENQ
ncbi:MAG: hypothetical protein EHM48_07415 [Planctomycetaceae bacterium]|nr:MAG: hypothetical protein EHM48_07415 [Planctomycetaceae bacterium]